MPKTAVGVVKLAFEVVGDKRKSATLSEWNKDMNIKLVKARVVEKKMREQLEGAERSVTALKNQLEEAPFVLGKLTDELF